MAWYFLRLSSCNCDSLSSGSECRKEIYFFESGYYLLMKANSCSKHLELTTLNSSYSCLIF
jgi:hypothetical protein